MGIIRVETPEGIARVEIEGNEPTEQELQDIEQQFYGSSEHSKRTNISRFIK